MTWEEAKRSLQSLYNKKEEVVKVQRVEKEDMEYLKHDHKIMCTHCIRAFTVKVVTKNNKLENSLRRKKEKMIGKIIYLFNEDNIFWRFTAATNT